MSRDSDPSGVGGRNRGQGGGTKVHPQAGGRRLLAGGHKTSLPRVPGFLAATPKPLPLPFPITPPSPPVPHTPDPAPRNHSGDSGAGGRGRRDALGGQQSARTQPEQRGQRVAQAAQGGVRARAREAAAQGRGVRQRQVEQRQRHDAQRQQQQRLQRAQRPQPADRPRTGRWALAARGAPPGPSPEPAPAARSPEARRTRAEQPRLLRRQENTFLPDAADGAGPWGARLVGPLGSHAGAVLEWAAP